MSDIPLIDAMICANAGKDYDPLGPRVKVFRHPYYDMLSREYSWSVGACDDRWDRSDDLGRKLLLMIEAHHLFAFHNIPAPMVHEALMVIPEYRDMLSYDVLPARYQQERDAK